LRRYTVKVRNAPPKNITSVARNAHMPSVLASRCWARSSNWCARTGTASPAAGREDGSGAGKGHLLLVVLVGSFLDHGSDGEVLRRRRRWRLPLEPGGFPVVRAGGLPVPER